MDDECELEIPITVELKESNVLNNELGVFCTIQLEADQFLGSYKGKIRKSMTQCGDSEYVWTILSSRQVPLFYIDASDPKDSNWLRFIRSTADITKYNVICMQQNQQINYFTQKRIKPGEELITYLPRKKLPIRNKSKRSTYSVVSTMRQQQQSFNGGSYSTENSNSTNDIVKLSGKPAAASQYKTRFTKHNTTIGGTTSHATKQQQQQKQQQLQASSTGPNTRSKQNLIRKTKSDNITQLITTSNSSDNKSSPGKKRTRRSLLLLKSKKIVNKKTQFKCTICSYTSNMWHDVKLHLYQRHINSKFIRINNKHRKLILKEINKRQVFRRRTAFIQNECKCVLDGILDKLENPAAAVLADKNEQPITSDFDKYCLYKCHLCNANVNNCFVYKSQLSRHLAKSHRNELDNDAADEDEEEEDDGGSEEEEEEEHSDSDYNSDNEVNLEKKLVDVKVLNENDDVIELDDYDEAIDDEENEVEDEEEEAFNLVRQIENLEEETRDCLPDVVTAGGGGDIADDDDQSRTTTSSSTAGEVKEATAAAAAAKTAALEEPNLTSPSNENTNDEDIAKFTCNLCKRQFDDRLTMIKHQRSEMSMKMLKKRKEVRKKKWRDIQWKRKVDLSYIETTQLNNLSQNIADNLSFCIDGTQEDLRSYNKEVKDYLSTELGQETDLQMFLKCFPDLYEELADQLQHIEFMDINLNRKANAYFAQCCYTPKDSVSSGTNCGNRSLHSTGAISSVYHCRNCRLKFKSLPDLVQHQRFTHNLTLKTTFDTYNSDYDQDGDLVEQQQQVAPVLLSKEKLLSSSSSPIGYLRCDPYAFIMNLYLDHTDARKCEKCGSSFMRKVYEKHVETCGLAAVESDQKPTHDEVEFKEVASEHEDEESKHSVDAVGEPLSSVDSTTTPQPDTVEEEVAPAVIVEELFVEEKIEEIKTEEEVKPQTAIQPIHQHETRLRKRSARLIDDLNMSNVLTNKRQVKNSYASEHFVYFDGKNQSYRKSAQNYEAKSRQITATVSKRAKSASLAANSSINEELTNEAAADDAKQTVPSQTSPSLLVTALNSCASESKAKGLRRGAKKKQLIDEEATEQAEQFSEKRTSKRIKKEAELNDNMETDAYQNSTKTSASNLSQIVNTPQSEGAVKLSTTEASSTNTSLLEINETTDEIQKSRSHYLEHICEKCGLEFTSANSVTRHQEKSCLRIHLFNLEDNSIKCPICGKIYPTTHQISIHISKYHGSLLGASSVPPTEEAKRLYEIQSNTQEEEACSEKRSRKKTNSSVELEIVPSSPSSSSSAMDTTQAAVIKKRNSRSNSQQDANKKRKSIKDEDDTSLKTVKKSLSLSPTIISIKKTKSGKLKATTKQRRLAPAPALAPPPKRCYTRKTLDNSEITHKYHRKSAKQSSANNEDNSNEALTLDKLVNEEITSHHHQHQQEGNTYKSSLHEDEFIIHNDDDDDDENASNSAQNVNELIYN